MVAGMHENGDRAREARRSAIPCSHLSANGNALVAHQAGPSENDVLRKTNDVGMRVTVTKGVATARVNRSLIARWIQRSLTLRW